MAVPYSSEYLLQMFNRKAGRPEADSISNASKYERLSESQHYIVAELAAVYPEALVGPTLPMLTVDSKVFTFGLDGDGNKITPFGKTGIYTQRSGVPGALFNFYLDENTQIRIPNDLTHSGDLYWRGVVMPPAITATIQPALFPLPARELIVIDAVRKFATEYVRNSELADRMEAEWDGNAIRTGAWPRYCLMWRTQYERGGAIDVFSSRDFYGPVNQYPSAL